MYSWLFLIFSMLVAVPAVFAEESPLPLVKKYYPLQVGATWQFDMKVQGNSIKMTNRVAKLENIDGVPLYRVETAIHGQTSATEHLSQTEQGLFRNRFNGIELTPPLPLLKNPVELGESWKTKVEMGDQTVEISCAVADAEEKISVPAGEYHAVKLTVETKVDGAQILSDYWFAADIGIVKQYLDIGGQIIEIELREYQALP